MKKIVGILLAFTIILCNSMITWADVTWDGTNYSPINGNIFTRYISLSGKLTSIDNAAITNGLTVGTVTISIDTENDGGSND